MATAAITKDITEAKTWLQKHERMLIVTLVLAAGLFFGNMYLNGSAARAEAKAAALQTIVDNDKEVIAKLEQQGEANAKATAEAKAQYQQIIDTLERQNASLATAVAARNTQLAQTQANIQTAPLDDVAKSIISSAKLSNNDLTVSESTGIVTQFGMRQIASELVKVPVLEANVSDIQKIADNRQSELDKANEVISTQNTQVIGLNNTVAGLHQLVADGDKNCKAQIDVAKKDARKSKRNWFVGGVLTGIAIGVKVASLIL